MLAFKMRHRSDLVSYPSHTLGPLTSVMTGQYSFCIGRNALQRLQGQQ